MYLRANHSLQFPSSQEICPIPNQMFWCNPMHFYTVQHLNFTGINACKFHEICIVHEIKFFGMYYMTLFIGICNADSTCPKFNLLDLQGLLSKEVLSCASFTPTICWHGLKFGEHIWNESWEDEVGKQAAEHKVSAKQNYYRWTSEISLVFSRSSLQYTPPISSIVMWVWCLDSKFAKLFQQNVLK